MIARNDFILIALLMLQKVFSEDELSPVIVITGSKLSSSTLSITPEIASTSETEETLNYSSAISTTVLPELLDFKAKVKDSFTVELSWNNASDIPFSIFYNSTYKEEVEPGKNNDFINSTFKIITGLRPWTTYIFFTKLNNSNWIRQRHGIVTTFEGIPHQPTDLFANVEARGLDLFWSAPKIRNGNINYTVNYVTDNGSPLEQNVTQQNLTKFRVDNLCPDNDYNFSVRAYTTAGFGNFSDIYKITTYSEVLTAPKNLSHTEVTSDRIHLVWANYSECSPKILYFNVTYWSTLNESSISKNTTDYEIDIEDLKPYTNYTFLVQPITKKGGPVCKDCEKYIVQTDETVPDEPVDVNYSILTKNWVVVTWSPPKIIKGNILGYFVFYKEKKSNDWSNIAVTITRVNITELKAFTEYQVQILAYTIKGNGTSSDELLIKTTEDVPGKPKKLKISNLTETSASAYWLEPDEVDKHGIIIGYNLEWGLDLGNSVNFTESVDLSQLYFTYNILNLEAFTKYCFKIRAKTSIGFGDFTDKVCILTDIGVPNKPQNITMVVKTSTSIKLEWNKPTPFTGPTNYSIGICTPDQGAYKICFTYNISETLSKNLCPFNEDLIQLVCNLEYTQTDETIYNLKKFHNYTFYILAFTLKGVNYSKAYKEETKPDVPEKVTDLKIISDSPLKRTVSWKKPHIQNGILELYQLNINGTHMEDEKQKCTSEKSDIDKCETCTFSLDLIVECIYSVQVAAKTKDVEKFGDVLEMNFTVNATAPSVDINPSQINSSEVVNDKTTQISITIPKFGDTYGRIYTYAIIVSTKDKEENPQQCYVFNATCLPVSNWVGAVEKDIPYQVTNSTSSTWLPDFHSGRSIPFILGMIDCDKNTMKDQDCNNKLKPGTEYSIKVRAYTKGGYAEIGNIHKKTDPLPVHTDNSSLIGGIIAAVLILLVAVLLFVYIRKKNRGKCFPQMAGTHTSAIIGSAVLPKKKKIRRSRPVKIKDFLNHLDDMKADSGLKFSLEYEELKTISPKCPCTAAELEANRSKNRYINISPFDYSRVKLLPTDDDESSDYINASYMPGFNSPREFIAAQGPLPGTKDDFWRLIWEQNVSIIVMVTQCVEKGRKKCEQYWPNENEPQFFGDLQVNLQSESVLSDYTLRVLEVQLNSERIVKHMHFTKWPDFGCPQNSSLLIDFVHDIRFHIPYNKEGPILVHCSAGVGRTGTFIAVDRLMQLIEINDVIDIFGIVLEMRQFRCNMVQTEDQYIYIHECIAEAIKNMEPPIYENGKLDTGV